MNAMTIDQPQAVDADLMRAWPLPKVEGEPDKDARGRVLIVAGGSEVPGAAILAAEAALRAGAGKLQMAATSAFAAQLAFAVPESRVTTVAGRDEFAAEAAADLVKILPRTDAVIAGPGILDDAMMANLVPQLLRVVDGPAFVLDAAALTKLNGRLTAPASGRLVLTPHAGEMAKLIGRPKEAVLAQPLQTAKWAAEALNAVVALKGETTHIVAPDGRAWIHAGGMLGLATSGSGDVLAGIIGGLLARGATPEQAAVWGVYLHGQAGVRLGRSIGPLGFLARELPAQVPAAMAEVG